MASRSVLLACAAALVCAGLAGLYATGVIGPAKAKDQAPPPPVPITQAAAKTEDVPVYLRGTAPIDGRVSLRQVDPGNLIETSSQSAGIVSIAQIRPISAVFTLPEQNLGQVQDAMQGGPLTVYADSADGRTQLAQGTLLTPNNQVDIPTGTVQFKATFENKDSKLWPGEFVDARLLVDTMRGVTTVPHGAVQHGQDGLFVFAVKPDNTVQQQSVTVAYDDGTRAVVSKGVSPGQNVVTAGQSRLGNGTHVTLAPPDQVS